MSRGERVCYATEREKERERERDSAILERSFSSLLVVSNFCSFLLLWFFGLSSKMKQKAEGEQTNSRLDGNIK
jgi:hypothetical protein